MKFYCKGLHQYPFAVKYHNINIYDAYSLVSVILSAIYRVEISMELTIVE